MLKEPFQDKKQKQRMFQSLFLSNDRNQEVWFLRMIISILMKFKSTLMTADLSSLRAKTARNCDLAIKGKVKVDG